MNSVAQRVTGHRDEKYRGWKTQTGQLLLWSVSVSLSEKWLTKFETTKPSWTKGGPRFVQFFIVGHKVPAANASPRKNFDSQLTFDNLPQLYNLGTFTLYTHFIADPRLLQMKLIPHIFPQILRRQKPFLNILHRNLRAFC